MNLQSRPIDEIDPLVLATSCMLSQLGSYAPGPGTLACGSAGEGRCVLVANEELFIFSVPLRAYMSCSRPVSVSSGVYVSAAGVSSAWTSMPALGLLALGELLSLSSRLSVPPKPAWPFWPRFWNVFFASAAISRLAFGSYMPGSVSVPLTPQPEMTHLVPARAVCDLNADEQAGDEPGRSGSYAPGPGTISPALRSDMAFIRTRSSAMRSEGDKRVTVGRQRLDGGIGGVDGPSITDSGEPGLRFQDFMRSSPRARRALAVSDALMRRSIEVRHGRSAENSFQFQFHILFFVRPGLLSHAMRPAGSLRGHGRMSA